MSYFNGKSILLKGAIPDETVLASITEQKKSYVIAQTEDIIEASESRTVPQCKFYNHCGGCHYQHISYEKQVSIKESILLDCLRRIGQLEIELSAPLISKPFRYRYKAVFKTKTLSIGFYKANTRDIVEIDDCLIVKEDLIEAKKLLKEFVKNIDDAEIEIICGIQKAISIKSRQGAVKRCFLVDDSRLLDVSSMAERGNHLVELKLNDLKYLVSPFSFFQSNWELNNKVVKLVIDSINLEGKDIIDIYSGAGNFALPISRFANSVTAYEESKKAVECGILNAKINKIDNCLFIQSRAEHIKTTKSPDVVIINPPRAGITNKAMENIINLKANEIIYMSCDPSTLARDLGKLKKYYTIASIRLIDFFPQTFHIEAIAMMRKK